MRKRGSKAPLGQKVPVVVGKVVEAPLDSVKPNSWNPNRLTPFEKQALLYGLRKDGWLPSHAATIWRTDTEGNTINVIVDGEHRWRAAREIGMTTAPMVFLDGLTEAQAKALTVKLDAKRGRFNRDKLTLLLKDITREMDQESRALDLGIAEDEIGLLLEGEQRDGVLGDLPSGQQAQVKIVQMFFTPERHEVFQKRVKEVAVKLKTTNVSDTVLEAVRRAAAAQK